MEKYFLIFVSTFLGAVAAFLLEAGRRRAKEIKDRYEAILATQATLISQANSMFSIGQQLQAAEGENPFQNLKHCLTRFSQRSIDFGSLTFLAASSQPQLLLDLEVAQENFRFAVELIDHRNKALDRFYCHPKTVIEELEGGNGEVRATGDPRLIRELKQVSDAVATAFLMAQNKNKLARDRFFAFARSGLPRRFGKKLLFVQEENAPTSAVSSTASPL